MNGLVFGMMLLLSIAIVSHGESVSSRIEMNVVHWVKSFTNLNRIRLRQSPNSLFQTTWNCIGKLFQFQFNEMMQYHTRSLEFVSDERLQQKYVYLLFLLVFSVIHMLSEMKSIACCSSYLNVLTNDQQSIQKKKIWSQVY